MANDSCQCDPLVKSASEVASFDTIIWKAQYVPNVFDNSLFSKVAASCFFFSRKYLCNFEAFKLKHRSFQRIQCIGQHDELCLRRDQFV